MQGENLLTFQLQASQHRKPNTCFRYISFSLRAYAAPEPFTTSQAKYVFKDTYKEIPRRVRFPETDIVDRCSFLGLFDMKEPKKAKIIRQARIACHR